MSTEEQHQDEQPRALMTSHPVWVGGKLFLIDAAGVTYAPDHPVVRALMDLDREALEEILATLVEIALEGEEEATPEADS